MRTIIYYYLIFTFVVSGLAVLRCLIYLYLSSRTENKLPLLKVAKISFFRALTMFPVSLLAYELFINDIVDEWVILTICCIGFIPQFVLYFNLRKGVKVNPANQQQ
ncbi:MAG: hypothetical protein K1X72_25325 [Pyrinomonadaceae bacterium]|nr:hypothetical protein [Pyrinomonadaceae bacterium]